MTQMNTVSGVSRRRSAGNNIYTVLALVALLVLIAGIVFVAMRSTQVFGTSSPFEIPDVSAAISNALALLA